MGNEAGKIQVDTGDKPAVADPKWDWHPDVPLVNSPIFIWPPRPIDSLKSLASNWIELTGRVVFLVTAILSWMLLTRTVENVGSFNAGEFGWIAHIYIRNLLLLIVMAGSIHLYFFRYTKQGKRLQFDARPLIKNGRMFTFSDQVHDNMFWSLTSGVFFWTFWEVVLLGAQANGFAPLLAFGDSVFGSIWFVAMFVLIPLWYSFFFYWVHRALHWPPLYKRVHALHHRNINLGPWSGMAMHPVEHLIYLASPLIHFVVPSSPLHVIFHLQFNVLISIFSHSGFEALLVDGKKRVGMGYFFHQLHHRYFECNYGTDEMPWDKWFGTFHDGTADATVMVKDRRRQMYATKSDQ